MTQEQFEATAEFKAYRRAYEDYMKCKSTIRLARLVKADKALNARYEEDADYFLSPYRR